ncbi:hypothetical protein ACFO9E_34985 [Streptomyces maoxianensis]|uniref:Resolvase/invertase-type recombinase catalytic domain-containing protein n=1 Tax=Streptomyces maoxianensis TaxID=1459942 RepID=A0ABV9GI78_9ACTN
MAEAGCSVFSEKIITRIKVRPEFVKALDFARTIKKAVPHQRVVFTVHAMKRLGRGAAELLSIAGDLRTNDIELELLTGLSRGLRPHGARCRPLRVLRRHGRVRTRVHPREIPRRTGIRSRRGRYGGRPKVFDDDMAHYARTLRASGVSVPEIAAKLFIPTGKNREQGPEPIRRPRLPCPRRGRTGELSSRPQRPDHAAIPSGRTSADSPEGHSRTGHVTDPQSTLIALADTGCSVGPTDANCIGCEKATPVLEVGPGPYGSGPTRDADLGTTVAVSSADIFGSHSIEHGTAKTTPSRI